MDAQIFVGLNQQLKNELHEYWNGWMLGWLDGWMDGQLQRQFKLQLLLLFPVSLFLSVFVYYKLFNQPQSKLLPVHISMILEACLFIDTLCFLHFFIFYNIFPYFLFNFCLCSFFFYQHFFLILFAIASLFYFHCLQVFFRNALEFIQFFSYLNHKKKYYKWKSQKK